MQAVIVILSFVGIAVFTLLFLDRVTGKLVNPYSRKYRHRLPLFFKRKHRAGNRHHSGQS